MSVFILGLSVIWGGVSVQVFESLFLSGQKVLYRGSVFWRRVFSWKTDVVATSP